MILGEAFVAVRPETAGFGGAIEKQLGAIFATMTSPAALLGETALAGGAVLLEVGEHFEQAFFRIQQQTGATGEALHGLEENFKDVFATAPGATFQNVADAVSEISVRTHLTGEALDEFARKEIELGKITKTDVGENVKVTTALFGLFGIAAEEQAGKLDVLFKASQVAGVSLTSIDEAMKAVAPTSQMLGLSFDQTAAMVANLSKLGLPAQKVMMGLSKEFATAAKAGEDPVRVINDMVEAIKAAPDPTAAAALATKDFGIGARQAATLVAALRAGTLDLGDTLAKITSGTGGIEATAESTMTLGDKFGLLKNKALVALEPISMKVLDLANVIVDGIPSAVGVAGDAFRYLWEAARPTIERLELGFDAMRSAFSGEGVTSDGFVGAMERIGVAARTVFDLVERGWDRVRPIFTAVGDYVADHLEPIFSSLTVAVAVLAGAGGLAVLASVIGGILTALGALAVALASPVVVIGAIVAGLVYAYQTSETFRDVVAGAVAGVESAFYAVRGAVLDFVDGFRLGNDEVSTWGRVFATAGAAVRGALDAVVETVGQLVDFYGPRLADVWTGVVAVWDTDVYPALRDRLLPVLKELVSWIGDHLPVVAATAGIALALMISPVATVVAGFALLYARSETFRNAVDSTASAVRDFALGLQNALGPGLAAVGGSLADFARFFVERWEKIRDAVENVVKGIAIGIAVALAPAMFVWQQFNDQILAVVTLVWNQVGLVVETAVRVIGDVFDFVIAVLTGQWGDAWAAVQDIFAAAFDYLVGSFGNLLGFVVDFFSSLPGNMLDALGDLAGLLLGVGETVVGGLVGGMVGALGAVLDFFIGLPALILNTLLNVDLWLFDTGVHLVGGILSGIGTAFVGVVNWFLGLPGTIAGLVTAAPSWLYDTGKAVVQGMIDGMISLGGAVGTAVEGAMKGAVNAVIAVFNKGIDFLDSFQVHVHKTMPSVIPNIDIDWDGLNIPHIPTLHAGGVVPGKPGQEVWAKLLAGELVVPTTGAKDATAGLAQTGAVAAGIGTTNQLLAMLVELLRDRPDPPQTVVQVDPAAAVEVKTSSLRGDQARPGR